MKSGMPARCAAPVFQSITDWQNTDACNWEALSNHYCSHQVGWVEINRGTCQAGGPPPICPRTDHWRYDPAAAARFLRDDQQRTTSAREAELASQVTEACNCWAGIVDAETENPTPIDADVATINPDAAPSALIGFCTANQCPPGYRCYKSRCYLQSAFQKAEVKVESKLVGTVSDKFIETALKAVKLSPMAVSAATDYILPLMSATSINTGRDGYSKALPDYDEKIKEATKLLFELADSVQLKPPSRAPSVIKEDLIRITAELQNRFSVLDAFADKVVRDGEISRANCPAVFSAQHRRVSRAHANMIATLQGAVSAIK
jgi:hypothetical protein